MSLLRSLLITTPLLLIATVVMWLCSMIASLFDPSGNWQHQMARIWGRILLAVSFMRVRVRGLEQLDLCANYVFVSNHSSYMDIPALLARLPFQFRFFAKKGLYKIPFLGWHLHRAGHLPVDRSNARNSLRSMSAGSRIVTERGVSVLLFPEGGRTKIGLREFKEGAAYIAIKAGVPVAPVALKGMRELLPMGSIHLRSGQAELRVGAPIPTAGLTLSDRDALTQKMHAEIHRLLAE
jgi:1-acyl-sn-glycerol-3-phosphate acyltransferase